MGKTQEWSIDWQAERNRQLGAQRAHGHGLLYGLSPAEVISDLGATAYLEAGAPTPNCAKKDGLEGYGGPWYMPHYVSMSASLDIPGAEKALAHQQKVRYAASLRTG